MFFLISFGASRYFANQDTLGTFEVAATLGEEALGAQVISMASSPSDVLAVKLMQVSKREAPTSLVVALVHAYGFVVHRIVACYDRGGWVFVGAYSLLLRGL